MKAEKRGGCGWAYVETVFLRKIAEICEYAGERIRIMKFEPELLRFANRTPITTPEQWPARREELLDILRREEYGYSPAAPDE